MNSSIYVTRSSMPLFDEYIEELKPIWESRWLSNRGAAHKKLEDNLKRYLNVEHVQLFANGHLALEGIFESLELEGEVITTPFTHCSTLHSIVRTGLVPVFCDIKSDNLTIDPELIEAKITDKTVAIFGVHVYGFLCDDEVINAIAKKHNLHIIYDAAHAFGVKQNGMSAANMGDASMYSTHATKVYQTVEGGIVTYNDDELFASMRKRINFGFTSPETVDYIGTNARMSEFHAAMGLCNLKHFDKHVENRKLAGDRYYERLGEVKGIRLLEIPENLHWNYAYMPIIVDGYKENRDELQAKLNKENIFPRKYFYPLVTNLGCYVDTYGGMEYPVAESAAEGILSLPIYSDLTVADVDRICDVILA